jgi:hypothetical protein
MDISDITKISDISQHGHYSHHKQCTVFIDISDVSNIMDISQHGHYSRHKQCAVFIDIWDITYIMDITSVTNNVQSSLTSEILWTPPYTPGDGQTSLMYSNNPVLHLYINCYVTVNKPVLSYLLLRLLPQWWPRPGCTLWTVHSHVGSCTRYRIRSLSRLHKWYFRSTFAVYILLATT